jgi:hypothetical protein
MWSRRVLLATLVAAAAVTMMRHGPSPGTGYGNGYANAHSIVATSFR